MLPKSYKDISEFLNKTRAEKYKFRWVNIPIDKLYTSSVTEYLNSNAATGRYCATHKMMVNRKTWLADPRARCSPHDFSCCGSTKLFQDPSASGNTPFIIHFLIRGYLHTAIKVLEQRLPTERGRTPKTVLVDFMNKEIPIREYPFRFLSACGEYCICNKNYLRNKSKWRIPEYKRYSDRTLQTNKLYIQTLEKFKLCKNKDILTNDIYNIGSKIKKCTDIIIKQGIGRMSRQMPSRIPTTIKSMLS